MFFFGYKKFFLGNNRIYLDIEKGFGGKNNLGERDKECFRCQNMFFEVQTIVHWA